MTAKTDKNVLIEVKAIYQSGAYKSIPELAKRYSINPSTLQNRITREKWNVKREIISETIERKVEEKALSQVDEYLSNSFSRAKKYEKIIDATIAQHGTDAEGNPLVEIEDLDSLTRSELRIHELAKSALRIPTMSQSDITTGGKSLGESLVSAIAKLRATGGAVNITPEEHQRLINLEVEPKKIA